MPSDYDELFNNNAEPKETNEGTGGDTALVLPDEDWVPADLKGKPIRDGLTQLSTLRKEMADQSKALAEMTKIAEQRKAAEANEVAKTVAANPVDTALDLLMEMRVEQTTKDDPLLSKYKGEITAMLKQVRDPNIRMTPEALQMVIAQVRGAHYDEGIKMVEEKLKKGVEGTGDSIRTDAIGGRFVPPSPAINVTPERKANLAAWFEGDLDAARRNLIGEGS